MSRLVFPDRVTIRVQLWAPNGITPWSGAEIAFRVRTFAHAKSDYLLGPFFCDLSGFLVITRQQLEAAERSELSAGLMDYEGDHYSLVDIAHLSANEVAGYIKGRTTVWTHERDEDRELYGSLPQFLTRLRQSANHLLRPPSPRTGKLRDEWDGSVKTPGYEYRVSYLPKRRIIDRFLRRGSASPPYD